MTPCLEQAITCSQNKAKNEVCEARNGFQNPVCEYGRYTGTKFALIAELKTAPCYQKSYKSGKTSSAVVLKARKVAAP